MDLTTEYLGIKLKNPLVASASPLTEKVDNFRRLEDAGVSAIVCHSLFEEQLKDEAQALDHYMTQGTNSFAEALDYFPEPEEFILGPDQYLSQITQAKKAVKIPVIGSINGYTSGGWTKYAKLIEEAGADALELNVYFIPTDIEDDGVAIEQKYIDILKNVKAQVKIPVAVKLSPHFSSIANMAKKLDGAGADGLVLFNRFYQPDIDLETLEIKPNILLSSSFDMRLPMRWIAILSGQINASLAATSGIHTASDVLKMILVGADVTMICSTLFKNGFKQVKNILEEMQSWMEKNEYVSIQQMKGSMSQKSCADPQSFERGYYIKTLQSYHVDV